MSDSSSGSQSTLECFWTINPKPFKNKIDQKLQSNSKSLSSSSTTCKSASSGASDNTGIVIDQTKTKEQKETSGKQQKPPLRQLRRRPKPGKQQHKKMGILFGKPDDGSSDEYSDEWSKPWRDDEKKHKVTRPVQEKDWKMRFLREKGVKDMEKYRKHYPGKTDDPEAEDNYLFHTNQLLSKPEGDYIDDIHRKWWGDYDKLERHHGYIQWLFPIRESGMNWHSQELQLHEIKRIMEDEKASQRLLKSYEMMLDFYGIILKDPETGEVGRAEHWQPRFQHLNRSMHNYLRITRILKCLGELGYERFKAPWIKFLLDEAGLHKTLHNTLESCIVYWIETVRDEKERIALREHVKLYTR